MGTPLSRRYLTRGAKLDPQLSCTLSPKARPLSQLAQPAELRPGSNLGENEVFSRPRELVKKGLEGEGLRSHCRK